MECRQTQVSIIMPVFNAEKYLREAIESVCRQTFLYWELILVDDGSVDNSGKICDEYAQRDERIRVFHTANGGVSRARNTGIENAKGKWISFLDSDDFIREDCLETFLNYSDGVDLVVCSTQVVPTGEIRKVSEKVKYYSSLQDTLKDIDKLLLTYFYANVWNKLYLREKVTMRFDINLSIGEDTCFNAEYMKNCQSICVLPDALNNYRTSSENSLSKRFRSKLIDDSKPAFFARMSYMGESTVAKRYVNHRFIERVMEQSVLLAGNKEYSLAEKKRILDQWANSDFWRDDVFDLSATQNKRYRIYLNFLQKKKTWTALLLCVGYSGIINLKKRFRRKRK